MLGKIAIGIILLAGALWVSLGFKIGETLPAHAMLLANSHAKIYVTVPCVIAGSVEQSYVANVNEVVEGTDDAWYEPFVVPMRRDETRRAGMRPDKACADAGGFIELKPWLFSLLNIGRSRVTDEGDVLW